MLFDYLVNVSDTGIFTMMSWPVINLKQNYYYSDMDTFLQQLLNEYIIYRNVKTSDMLRYNVLFSK